jgi:hypothetical protein
MKLWQSGEWDHLPSDDDEDVLDGAIISQLTVTRILTDLAVLDEITINEQTYTVTGMDIDQARQTTTLRVELKHDD